MKKLLSFVLVLTLLLSSGVMSFAAAGETTKRIDKDGTIIIRDHSNDEIIKDINRLENKEEREKILNLLLTPAYEEISIIEGEQDSFKALADNSNSQIKNLLNLSGKDLDDAIGNIIKETMKKNEGKKGIVWDQGFIGNYVKKYAPNSVSHLEKVSSDALNLMEMIDAEKEKINSTRATTTDTITAKNIIYSGSGSILKGLKIVLTYSYNETCLWGLYPTTTTYESTGHIYFGMLEDEEWINSGSTAAFVHRKGSWSSGDLSLTIWLGGAMGIGNYQITY